MKAEKPYFSVQLAEWDKYSSIARHECNSREKWLVAGVVSLAKRIWGERRILSELKKLRRK